MTSPRKKYIIANWKMNFTPGEASLYLSRLSRRIDTGRNLQIVLAPSLVALQTLSLQINRRQFKLAAQNFYWRDSRSFVALSIMLSSATPSVATSLMKATKTSKKKLPLPFATTLPLSFVLAKPRSSAKTAKPIAPFIINSSKDFI